jgi:hypothetical protein
MHRRGEGEMKRKKWANEEISRCFRHHAEPRPRNRERIFHHSEANVTLRIFNRVCVPEFRVRVSRELCPLRPIAASTLVIERKSGRFSEFARQEGVAACICLHVRFHIAHGHLKELGGIPYMKC